MLHIILPLTYTKGRSLKKIEWVLIVILLILSNFSTIYLVEQYFIPKVKTVSLLEIINDKEDESYKLYVDKKITDEEYSKKIDEKMKYIQEALDLFSNGKNILIAEEAMIKTTNNNSVSITESVKNYVKQNQNNSNK